MVANPIRNGDEFGGIEVGAFQANSKDAMVICLSAGGSISPVLGARGNWNRGGVADSPAKFGRFQGNEGLLRVDEKTDRAMLFDQGGQVTLQTKQAAKKRGDMAGVAQRETLANLVRVQEPYCSRCENLGKLEGV